MASHKVTRRHFFQYRFFCLQIDLTILHQVLNLHPLGRSIGPRTSHWKSFIFFWYLKSTIGIEFKRTRVYGCNGELNKSIFEANLTIFPKYITPTLLLTNLMTLKSWEIKRSVNPFFSCRSKKRFNIFACTEIPKAEVGSSRTRKLRI